MTCSNAALSWRCPAVTQMARMVPLLSQTRLTLLVKPPRERPRPWSAGSVKCVAGGPASAGGASGFFFRPGGRRVGAAVGGVEAPQVALDAAGAVQGEQERVEDPGPGAILAPAAKAVVDGLPGAVAGRGVRPGGAGVQVPEDAVDQGAVVVEGMAGLAVVVAVGEEGGDLGPLGVGEVKAVGHGSPPLQKRPARESGSQQR